MLVQHVLPTAHCNKCTTIAVAPPLRTTTSTKVTLRETPRAMGTIICPTSSPHRTQIHVHPAMRHDNSVNSRTHTITLAPMCIAWQERANLWRERLSPRPHQCFASHVAQQTASILPRNLAPTLSLRVLTKHNYVNKITQFGLVCRSFRSHTLSGHSTPASTSYQRLPHHQPPIGPTCFCHAWRCCIR